MSYILNRAPERNALSYPHYPGWRGTTTSLAGAVAIAPKVKSQTAKIWDALVAHPAGLTSDEVAQATGLIKYQVRSRLSELKAADRIVDTEKRRESEAGVDIIVWIAVHTVEAVNAG